MALVRVKIFLKPFDAAENCYIIKS
jgi:hypothetical protein